MNGAVHNQEACLHGVMAMKDKSRRTQKAEQRQQELVARYEAEGLSPEQARERATTEMRDNARGDWRAG